MARALSIREAAKRLGMGPPLSWVRAGRAALRMRYKRRFVVRIGDTHVRFVTEDPHARSWFHSRYGRGDQHEPAVTKAIASQTTSSLSYAIMATRFSA